MAKTEREEKLMKSICNDCKHVIKTVQAISSLWQCGKTIVNKGGQINYITGQVYEPTYEECRKVNKGGNCSIFEKRLSLTGRVVRYMKQIKK